MTRRRSFAHTSSTAAMILKVPAWIVRGQSGARALSLAPGSVPQEDFLQADFEGVAKFHHPGLRDYRDDLKQMLVESE